MKLDDINVYTLSKRYGSYKDLKQKAPHIIASLQDTASISELEAVFARNSKYSIVECIFDALRFPTETLWKTHSKSIYTHAKKASWVELCLENHSKITDFQACLNEALKWPNKNQWKRNGRFYTFAEKHTWFEACTLHMHKRKVAWTIDECIKDASKYSSVTDWHQGKGSAYAASRKLGCFDECVAKIHGSASSSVGAYTQGQNTEDLFESIRASVVPLFGIYKKAS